MQSAVELLTVLSIIYMYHHLGKKKRVVERHEKHYTIDGLVNNNFSGDISQSDPVITTGYGLK
jgi:hypothetical protein